MNWLGRWEIFAFGSAIFASVTALFSKLGVANLNSNLATLIRTSVVLGVTALILSLRNEWQKPETIDPKTWIFLILSGIATALSWLCYYHALSLGPVSRVASIDKLSIILTIFLGIILLGEKLTWQVALGGGLITLGAVIIVIFS